MRIHRLTALFAFPAILFLGCAGPKTVPQKAIQVQVISNPGNATIFMAGHSIGKTPQTLSVDTADELLQMTATIDKTPVVEKRIRFLSLDKVEVTFVLGANNSAMAKALGLTKILIFDYGVGVSFEVNRSALRPEFLPLLDRQATLLKAHFSNQDIFVCGHTDSVGASEHNMSLSMSRARTVANDLGSRGVTKSKMKIQGFGSTYPLTENDTEQGRAMNRRTELVLPLE